MLLHYLALPRAGHLEQALHIFAYLKTYNWSTMVFDDTYPDFDESRFQKCDWSDFYLDVAEVVLANAPEPGGKPVVMTCFCNASHGSCMSTR
jgi:hypothetical protein